MNDERTFETTSAIQRLTGLPQNDFEAAKATVDSLEQIFPDMPQTVDVFRSIIHLASILREM